MHGQVAKRELLDRGQLLLSRRKELGGKGEVAAGLLIAVFMFTGWDATVYVNEEVKGRNFNPGKSAILAVSFLALVFIGIRLIIKAL